MKIFNTKKVRAQKFAAKLDQARVSYDLYTDRNGDICINVPSADDHTVRFGPLSKTRGNTFVNYLYDQDETYHTFRIPRVTSENEEEMLQYLIGENNKVVDRFQNSPAGRILLG